MKVTKSKRTTFGNYFAPYIFITLCVFCYRLLELYITNRSCDRENFILYLFCSFFYKIITTVSYKPGIVSCGDT